MFTWGQFRHAPADTLRGEAYIMTTLQMATPVVAHATDTQEAQDARWNTWKLNAAAADQITQGRMRLMFAVLLIALACITIAAIL